MIDKQYEIPMEKHDKAKEGPDIQQKQLASFWNKLIETSSNDLSNIL